MRLQITFPSKYGILVVLLFVLINPIFSQKITIKDGTAPVGHFFVEVLHNLPGAPMPKLINEGASIDVGLEENKFILRLHNFVWYDLEEKVNLNFNTQKINIQSDLDIEFDKNENIVLKPISSYNSDINLTVIGAGKVKLLIPFTYASGSGRFVQEFDINYKESLAEQSKEVNYSKRQIREAWKEVDQKSTAELFAFMLKFKDVKKAKKYVEDAAEIANELVRSDDYDATQESDVVSTKTDTKSNSSQENVSAKLQEENLRTSNAEELDSEKLKEDIAAIVDTLNNAMTKTTDELFVQLSLHMEGEETKEFKIHPSEMPLQFNFHQVGEEEMVLINTVPVNSFIADTSIYVNAELLEEFNLKGEFNSFNLINAQGNDIFQSSAISLVNGARKESNTLMYIIGLSGLLLAFGGFVIFNNRKKEAKRQETKKVFQAKMKENQERSQQKTTESGNQIVHSEAPSNGKKVDKPKIKIGAKQKPSIEAVAPVGAIPRNLKASKFKITTRKKKGNEIPYKEFKEIANNYKSVNVDLNEIWSDSAIRNVYLAPAFIKELDNFLADSSNDGIQNELQGAIPEVGGFMMGRFTKLDGSLEILVEKFVPFVPEYNDVFKIEIGTKTLVDELGDAQDKNPELEVIGWFHTHPGHGLFLSTSDLSVQRHFPKDYQVAMEIDSLTKGLDMSIFTRKSNGRMNNSSDRNEGAGWFQWVEIDNSNVQ